MDLQTLENITVSTMKVWSLASHPLVRTNQENILQNGIEKSCAVKTREKKVCHRGVKNETNKKM
jgi:hypothetical protein